MTVVIMTVMKVTVVTVTVVTMTVVTVTGFDSVSIYNDSSSDSDSTDI